MKTIILAGGLGTRLSELTANLPKPMVAIGGKPVLWHIMNTYASYNYKDFILALGYKAEVAKEYFSKPEELPWQVRPIDTGPLTQTGGRLKRLREWVGKETFMATYGDGLSDVNIAELVAFHKSHGKLATLTAVRPPARFGKLVLEGTRVLQFCEKDRAKEDWVNGGFFVLEPEVLDYIEGDDTPFEKGPLERLAKENQLMAHFHHGFWQPMDTFGEFRFLESLWQSGKAPWRVAAEV